MTDAERPKSGQVWMQRSTGLWFAVVSERPVVLRSMHTGAERRPSDAALAKAWVRRS